MAEILVKMKETKTIEMAFREWTTQKLIKQFKLKQLSNSPTLEAWLAYASKPIENKEKDALHRLRYDAITNIPFWNEDELKLNIIYPLVHLIHFRNGKQINVHSWLLLLPLFQL